MLLRTCSTAALIWDGVLHPTCFVGCIELGRRVAPDLLCRVFPVCCGKFAAPLFPRIAGGLLRVIAAAQELARKCGGQAGVFGIHHTGWCNKFIGPRGSAPSAWMVTHPAHHFRAVQTF